MQPLSAHITGSKSSHLDKISAVLAEQFTEKLTVVLIFLSCSKELNQWEPLTEYGQSKGHINPYLVLECAWRVSNWTAMKEALVQVSEGFLFMFSLIEGLLNHRPL